MEINGSWDFSGSNKQSTAKSIAIFVMKSYTLVKSPVKEDFLNKPLSYFFENTLYRHIKSKANLNNVSKHKCY